MIKKLAKIIVIVLVLAASSSALSSCKPTHETCPAYGGR
jgi:predicted small secreted protein